MTPTTGARHLQKIPAAPINPASDPGVSPEPEQRQSSQTRSTQRDVEGLKTQAQAEQSSIMPPYRVLRRGILLSACCDSGRHPCSELYSLGGPAETRYAIKPTTSQCLEQLGAGCGWDAAASQAFTCTVCMSMLKALHDNTKWTWAKPLLHCLSA